MCIYIYIDQYIYVRNTNGDGRKWAGYSGGDYSCTAHEHAPVCIPKRLAHWQLFRALPAEYPVNTEVEARERASTDDSYDEQQGKY